MFIVHEYKHKVSDGQTFTAAVTSLVLTLLLTQGCLNTNSSNTIIKQVNGTSLVIENDETAYRREVRNCHLNASRVTSIYTSAEGRG